MDGMLAFLFLLFEIGHRGAAFDAACRLDRAAGMQQGFEEGGFAGACVARESHVADVFGYPGHTSLRRRASGPATLRPSSRLRQAGAEPPTDSHLRRLRNSPIPMRS